MRFFFLRKNRKKVPNFQYKAVTLPSYIIKLHTMGKNINRIKVVLAEKQKKNKWLAE